MQASETNGNSDTIRYRLTRVEESVDKVESKVDKAISTLEAGITSLRNQLTGYQQAQTDRFLSLREYEERNSALVERLNTQSDQIQGIIRDNTNRGWGVALAIMTGAIAFIGMLVTVLSGLLKTHP